MLTLRKPYLVYFGDITIKSDCNYRDGVMNLPEAALWG
jgi:hypothetical protein